MRAPEARATLFRVFCLKTAYDVIIFKSQGGASAPPCTPPAGAHDDALPQRWKQLPARLPWADKFRPG